MLSGVGPADHLNQLGIASLVDLPVGRNLQDHPVAFLSHFTDEATLFAAGSEVNQSERRGPMSSNIGEGTSQLRLKT
jgi:choline dehydrogenase-like flavoprotein